MVRGRPCRLLKLVKRHCSADPMDPGIASPSGIFIGSCTKVRVRLPAEKPCPNVNMIPLYQRMWCVTSPGSCHRGRRLQ